MEIAELKNWFTSMVKPENMDSKPSGDPEKMEALLSRKDYFGIGFGVLAITASILFLSGLSVLLADAFSDPKGLINTMSAIMILMGLGFYGYALKMKPNSRFWGELGTYGLVIFFTVGFLMLGMSMEWFKEIKTGIFILLFLYVPVLYLRKNVLGGMVYAGLLIAYADEGMLGGSLGYLTRGFGSMLFGGEAVSFWFWFFFIIYIPYFTLSFRENFRPGIESILLGYYFAFLLLFGVSSALGSHQMFGLLLAASLLYLIGNIVYKHHYILFKPFQLISVIIFIFAAYAMMVKPTMVGMYASSGYMSFVSSILKEWTAYVVLIVLAVAAFMVFMIWKSEYVDNDRRANVIAVVLPFYFLLMAPLVNWGLKDVVVLLNIVVIMALAMMVTHYSLMDNKWYNLLWAPALAVSGLIALGVELDAGTKFNAFMMIVGAGTLAGLVYKYLPKIGETVTPDEGTGNDNTPSPQPAPAAPSPAPEVKAEPKEEPKAEEPAPAPAEEAPKEEEKSEGDSEENKTEE